MTGANRVGDALIARMAQDHCWSACMMDGLMNDIFFDIEPPITLWKNMNPHPLNRAQVVCSWIARDVRFEIGLIRAHDSRGRARNLRLFRLKEEYRPRDDV